MEKPMDTAVALVQTYLRLNGYFTVAEFPILTTAGHGPTSALRSATDIDILAVRFPGARHQMARGTHDGHHVWTGDVDAALRVPADAPDMLIGEVKEGEAMLNAAATDPAVIRAVLARFGCCRPDHAAESAARLVREGSVYLRNGHQVRLAAFGSRAPGDRTSTPVALCVTFDHILTHLQSYVREHWDELRVGGTKDPTLGLLLLQEKARRGAQRGARRGGTRGPGVEARPRPAASRSA
jgi:hypothetical protein